MKSFLLGLLALWLGAAVLRANSGDTVVVVYNSRLPDSKMVALHYAAARSVPSNQVAGFDLTTDETMSRADFRDQLQHPLLELLRNQGLLTYAANGILPISARVRYVVLCYGVPLRIAEDPSLIEAAAAKMPQEMRRNGAAVDSDLCLLPDLDPRLYLAGPLSNPIYGVTDARRIDPTHCLLMVTRLDGPSADIANHLVDKAMDAETNGLWGRAYFDLRGLTNGPFKEGDDWIAAAAKISRGYGFETVEDHKPETFPAGFPMSQIALYAGWYDWNASGPFASPPVEFMPGAFAYHLQSFSAQTLRSRTNNWCGPLLAEGVTATMGCVDEPFLDGTPNIEVFFARWVLGNFTFGEAAYACQRAISWQTTVIGDPLYRPFGQDPGLLHHALQWRNSKLIEWSHLRVVNLSLARGVKPGEVIKYLTDPSIPQNSPVLTEKLGDLYNIEGRHKPAAAAYRRALKLNPTPRQRQRLESDLTARPPH